MKATALVSAVLVFAATSSPLRIEARVHASAAEDGHALAAGAPGAANGASETREFEQQMCDLINRDRADPLNEAETHAQAQRLECNDQLAGVARAHSLDMAARVFFDHVNPDGVSPDMRVTAAGIEWQAEGENIALYGSVAGAERAFMNEARFAHNHRYNILNPKYTEVGVGIIKGSNGMYYITQEFVGAPKVPVRAGTVSAIFRSDHLSGAAAVSGR